MSEPVRHIVPVPSTAGPEFKLEHERGNSKNLRKWRGEAELRIMCERRLFGIVGTLRARGAKYVLLPGDNLDVGPDDAPGCMPLDGHRGRFEKVDGLCPCGRTHTLNLALVRASHDRLRHAAPRSRNVQVVELRTAGDSG